MVSPIRMKVYDHEFVLSSLDRHQLENLIWLRLAAVKDKVKHVSFEIARSKNEVFPVEHLVHFAAALESGHVVEICTTRVCKSSVLVDSVDQLKYEVERRIRFEANWFVSVLAQGKRCAFKVISQLFCNDKQLLIGCRRSIDVP